MLQSNISPNGLIVTPHHLATQSGLAILREGGTAIEAIVAAAATLSVTYPHMNSIGGDGMWLIVPPHKDPFVIDACGGAGALAYHDFFKGLDKIPNTGPKAANIVAGAIAGWQDALNYVTECGYYRFSVSRLLADAIKYADLGFPISSSHEEYLSSVMSHGIPSIDFKRIFLPDGKVPKTGQWFYQKKLAHTLKHLANNGLNSFYRANLAKVLDEDFHELGLPITLLDLQKFSAARKLPLRLIHTRAELYNTPPPTQGVASLAILGELDKLNVDGKHQGHFIHTSVEATKQAFEMRNKYVTDPEYMTEYPSLLLNANKISKMTENINSNVAANVNNGMGPGGSVWLGAMDNKGFSVSYIQSCCHVFGSGVVLPKTGILWHNRGTAFSLDPNDLQFIKPEKKPLSTLSPAAAVLNDGRVMIYGSKGGDTQPQTQAAIFHRYVVQGLPLQESVTLPRWFYGRFVGDNADNLKLEGRFSNDTIEYLKARGHSVQILSEFSSEMGHAGVLVRHPNGMMEGAFDPRSDGSAAGF